MFTLYQPKPRFQNLLRPACRSQAAAGITANPITVIATVISAATTLLMTIFPRRLLGGLRPIARTRVGGADHRVGVIEAVDREESMLLYPEGTHGEPEQIQTLKNGIAHLAKRFPGALVNPVYLHGLGEQGHFPAWQ